MNNSKPLILFFVILILAAFLRFYGVNWDQNQHLHPDERFLTMVTGAIEWPKNLNEFLDTNKSPLNPHNKSFNFFVYGTFPLILTKYIAEIFNSFDYNGVTLIGRKLSALFDLGTVILVFLISKQIISKKQSYFPHLAMLFYAISVLPIQLSHFYAVETFLTFFITLSFYLLIRLFTSNFLFITSILLGISFGLALASKISAVIFLPIILIGFIYMFFFRRPKPWRSVIICSLLFVLSSYFTLRFSQPYLFADSKLVSTAINPKVLANWKELQGYMKPQSGFPPSVQWFNTAKIIFPLKNMIMWGLGFPLGIASILSVVFLTIEEIKKRKLSFMLLVLIWIWELFIYQGIQSAPTIRYFHPIYPLLALITGSFLIRYVSKNKVLFIFLLAAILVWPLSFLSIYARPHSRITASAWIYENIAPHSNIAVEHWDDGLPLTLDDKRLNINYNYISLPLYDADTSEKWIKVASLLKTADYIVLTSNRLWGSITRVPDIYPITSKYYRLLFEEKLGFKKIAEITSFPSLPIPFGKTCIYILPSQEKFLSLKTENGQILKADRCNMYKGTNYNGIVIRDDSAEETFTVYDHPKVIIFQKINQVDYIKALNPQ